MTDTAGNVSQFVWYAPYGEALVDEQTAHYANLLKFSGKELDENTDLYDHVARNCNPITAIWYGIDELFENYPENGPYGYCWGNPVRFVDLDGRVRCTNGVLDVQGWDSNVQSLVQQRLLFKVFIYGEIQMEI